MLAAIPQIVPQNDVLRLVARYVVTTIGSGSLEPPAEHPANACIGEAIATLEPMTRGPSSSRVVGAALTALAEVLNVEPPSEEALQIYVGLLEPFPDDMISAGTMELLTTYRFKSFPPPADLITAIRTKLEPRLRLLRVLQAHRWRLRYHRMLPE